MSYRTKQFQILTDIDLVWRLCGEHANELWSACRGDDLPCLFDRHAARRLFGEDEAKVVDPEFRCMNGELSIVNSAYLQFHSATQLPNYLTT